MENVARDNDLTVLSFGYVPSFLCHDPVFFFFVCRGAQSEVYSLDWVSTMIASGSGDGRIRLWNSVTGECQASLGDSAGPRDGVTSVVLKQVR